MVIVTQLDPTKEFWLPTDPSSAQYQSKTVEEEEPPDSYQRKCDKCDKSFTIRLFTTWMKGNSFMEYYSHCGSCKVEQLPKLEVVQHLFKVVGEQQLSKVVGEQQLVKVVEEQQLSKMVGSSSSPRWWGSSRMLMWWRSSSSPRWWGSSSSPM